MVIIADFLEQMLAQSRALNGFQELFGNDQIGIDVDALKGGGDALERVKRLHGANMAFVEKDPTLPQMR